MTTSPVFITPDWPVPAHVRAAITTRAGGYSRGAWSSFNLAQHVDDAPDAVSSNRRLLHQALHLPDEPRWLQQVHGVDVLAADQCSQVPIADGAWTRERGCVLAVLTADCLPVIFSNRTGTVIAVAHAGWRGLAAGILQETLRVCNEPADTMLAWLGPAIGPQAFEVGEDVYSAFAAVNIFGWQTAFLPSIDRAGHWFVDLYQLARVNLQAAGVTSVYGGGMCTYTDTQRFYSYRRDGVTGRMATLLWLEQ